jgi:hypothetical protein
MGGFFCQEKTLEIEDFRNGVSKCKGKFFCAAKTLQFREYDINFKKASSNPRVLTIYQRTVTVSLEGLRATLEKTLSADWNFKKFGNSQL